MLFAISIVKTITEVALLALFGQWVLGLLVGSQKERNLFYQILQIVGSPFVSLARRISPRVVLDRHVPLVAFLLLLFVWIGVTLLKIQTCLRIGMALCR